MRHCTGRGRIVALAATAVVAAAAADVPAHCGPTSLYAGGLLAPAPFWLVAQPRDERVAVIGRVVDKGPEHIAIRSDETQELFEFLAHGNRELMDLLREIGPGERVEAVGRRGEGMWILEELHRLGGPPREGPERPEGPAEPERPRESGPESEPIGPATGPASYSEDFEGERPEGWELEPGWEIARYPRGNRCLHGQGHTWARYGAGRWGDSTLRLRLRLVRGAIHLNYRVEGPRRYFIGVHPGGLYLAKQTGPETFFENLARADRQIPSGRFIPIEIAGQGGRLEVRVDGKSVMQYADRDPLTQGGIAFETLEEAEVYIDDIRVTTAGAVGGQETTPTVTPTPAAPVGTVRMVEAVILPTGPVAAPANVRPGMPPLANLSNIQKALRWQYLGGPVGGLGYDVRMLPNNPGVMYVSDAWAGVFRSTDSGQTWAPSNKGITVRRGLTQEAFPIFCLTVSPHNPQVIWVGTKDDRGIFRSDDGGQSWQKMDQGLPFNGQKGITFRGFTVHPTQPNTVYAAAEISSSVWNGNSIIGKNFDRTRGVVYRTPDNGKTWTVFRQASNLARYILIDPRDPNVIYISTGIFDREAADATATFAGGVGIEKTEDGGKSWQTLNQSNGLGNLYVGSLFMHPQNPDILLAGTGCNPWLKGAGAYVSSNRGQSWDWTLQSENAAITAVEFATSDPTIAYAGGSEAIYRSSDTGKHWQRMTPPGKTWGPDGIRAGWPIDFQVDPKNPNRLFANAYGGGNFLSTDGGATWTNASKGYSGAQVKHLATHPTDATKVYAAGRSGVFVSADAGGHWAGLNSPPAQAIDWHTVAVDPNNPQHLLGASLWGPQSLFESSSGGQSWRVAHSLNNNAIAFRCTAFAPSNQSRVYAGVGGRATFGQFDFNLPGGGVYTSQNGGQTWNPANDSTSKDAHVRELAVHPTQAYILYAASYNRGLLRTDNNGTSWQARNPAASQVKNAHAVSVAIDPADPKTIYLGLYDAGLYKSTDEGLKWTASMKGIDPNAGISDIVFDPTDPKVMYVSDVKSGVYRSDNSGATWSKINLDLWNREVNALAISSDGNTLYAGTEGAGVFRLDVSHL